MSSNDQQADSLPAELTPSPSFALDQRIRVLNLSKSWRESSDSDILGFIDLVDSSELRNVLDRLSQPTQERFFTLAPQLRKQLPSSSGLDEIEMSWAGFRAAHRDGRTRVSLEALDWITDEDLAALLDLLEPYERDDLVRPGPSPIKERARRKLLLCYQGLLYERHIAKG